MQRFKLDGLPDFRRGKRPVKTKVSKTAAAHQGMQKAIFFGGDITSGLRAGAVGAGIFSLLKLSSEIALGEAQVRDAERRKAAQIAIEGMTHPPGHGKYVELPKMLPSSPHRPHEIAAKFERQRAAFLRHDHPAELLDGGVNLIAAPFHRAAADVEREAARQTAMPRSRGVMRAPVMLDVLYRFADNRNGCAATR